VADDGVILHTDNGAVDWKRQASGTDIGIIVHTADGGGSWKPMTSMGGDIYTSVASASPKSIWAVGIYGDIAHMGMTAGCGRNKLIAYSSE